MAQYVESACRSDIAAGALGQYLRVKTTGALALAGASDTELGTMETAALAAGACTIRLRTAQGTCKMVASEAITAGNPCYAAASGKVAATGTVRIGVAMAAATANNDIIEVMRDGQLATGAAITTTIEAHTSGDTLTTGESGSTHTNLGASGAVTLNLPQDAVAGTIFYFTVMAAQELRIDPGAAGAIYINGAKQTDNKYISADDEAEHVTLTCDGNGDWVAGPYNGTWSVEA